MESLSRDHELTSDWPLQCWINFPEQWHWRLYMTLVSTSLFFIPAVTIYKYLHNLHI